MVVVIGGGLAGMVVAKRCAEEGQKVTLLEAGARFGGRSQSLTIDGQVLEHGPEWFWGNPTGLLELCKELEVEVEPFDLPRKVHTVQGVWDLPPHLETASGAGFLELSKLPLKGLSRWKLGTERFNRSAPSTDETLADFVVRRLGQPLWEVMEPWLSSQWGGPAGELSLQAAYPALEALSRSGGLLSGKGVFSGRYVPKGGMGALVAALGHCLLDLGVEPLPKHPALGLSREQGQLRVHTGSQVWPAEAVVVALPGPQAAQFFRPSLAQTTTLINHFPHQHHSKVFLACRGDLEAAEHFWPDPVLRLRTYAPQQGIQWVGVETWGEGANQADGELSRSATAWVKEKLGLERPMASWVFRHPHSRVQFTFGQARRVSDLEAQMVHTPGVFLSGSYLAGPDPAQLVAHAQQTAHQVLDYLALTPGEA